MCVWGGGGGGGKGGIFEGRGMFPNCAMDRKGDNVIESFTLEDTIEISCWESFSRPNSSICGVLSLSFP